MNRLGLGVDITRGVSLTSLPSLLFSVPGSRGFFYDFSNYNTQFTDTAGTTPVTGVGQSLARINDASGLGNNATQATAGSRPLTQVRPMGVERRNLLTFTEQFDNAVWIKAGGGTGSAPVVTANTAIAPDGTLTADTIVFTLNGGTTSGDISQLSCSVSALSGDAAWSLYLKTSDNSTVTMSLLAPSGVLSKITVTGVWQRFSVTGSGGTTPRLRLRGDDGVANSASVHAWGAQLELGSTPTAYQRVVTANEWYEEGYTSYRGIAFDGVDDFLQTAAIDFAGAESLGPELVTNGTFASNVTGWANISDAGGSIAWNAAGYLDLINTTGTARTQQDFAVTAGRTYKFVVSNPGASTVDVYAGSTSGGGQLLTTTLTAGQTGTYILTATSSLMSLGFRNFGAGTTDSIDNVSVKEVLIAADKMTVVAGVRKLSDAARGMLVELGPPAATGTFRLEAPSAASPNYFFLSTGTASAGAGPVVTYAAPISNVVSGLSDVSGDLATLRVNGTQVAQSTADQGTGNYTNAAVYIGRRGGTTLPFNGILTFLCVINRTLTAAELAALEAYANSRTGAY